jgi:aminoglycoside phosphotransferase family enzyme
VAISGELQGSMTDLPAPLLTALHDPAAYPHPVAGIEHLETHISHVFLAGDYAYKLKKPVDFGFLDFTTFAKRRAACDDEVRLNRRLAPDWYLGVVPVCRAPDGIHLRPGGCGDAEQEIEMAVQMRRLPQEGLLDRLAVQGKLETAHMADIARQLAGFHARAARGPDVEQYGQLEAIRAPAIQNFEQTLPYVGRMLYVERHAGLRRATEDFLVRHAARFEDRVRAHRIVDGHGDLHLRNMCLVEGRVVIFDCIEFNPALRAGDVMNDIAFLTMDLDHRELPALANRFLNEYLEQGGDYSGLVLLDYYQAYRACVRAKVACFDSAQRPAALAEAAAYFALAQRYFAPRRGGLLITCGLSGSGKSTLARDVARELNGVMVRSDAVRKLLAGVPLTARGDATLYTPAMTERTYAALLEHARAIVASGRWAIVDAVHARPAERAAAAVLARELNVPFGILYCEAPHAELARRLDRRAGAGNEVSDADRAVLDKQLGFFVPPTAAEGPLCLCPNGVLPRDWRGRVMPGSANPAEH